MILDDHPLERPVLERRLEAIELRGKANAQLVDNIQKKLSEHQTELNHLFCNGAQYSLHRRVPVTTVPADYAT